jgi:MinD superfamily P-loop ATPase
MRELVVISGKGGTGKTSLTASFAALAEGVVIADCDVDAADLHLVMSPEVERREVFMGGHEARIRMEDCDGCGMCMQLCRFDAVRRAAGSNDDEVCVIDPAACEGCGVCVRHCPRYAIDFQERTGGEWYVSRTRRGPMVHAFLYPAAENSGKLVSLVREQARDLAVARGYSLVLIDGAPGIGCPVIASLTGVDLALVVTEPTVSGLHDLERVAAVARHFGVPVVLCVNKWDLNEAMTERIEAYGREHEMAVAGRVRYDPAVTRAQLAGVSLVEHSADGAAEEVRALWRDLEARLKVDALPTRAGSEAQGITGRSR